MKLIGINFIHYVSNMETKTKYILCCLDDCLNRKQIILNNDILEIKNVEKFNGLTIIPKYFIEIPDFESHDSLNMDINDFIKSCYDLILNHNLFKKTLRHKDKRPVWFFGGSSKNGKKYITSRLNLSKFLLNKHNFLPDLIECDVIVLGENNKYQLEDIKKRCIGENEYIYINIEEKVSSYARLLFSRCKYIYIFIGESNIGKTYISQHIENVDIYETDSSSILPTKLTQNIIILGQRYIFDIDDIISKYNKNCVFIYVEFQKI
jgi:hypothetical protein